MVYALELVDNDTGGHANSYVSFSSPLSGVITVIFWFRIVENGLQAGSKWGFVIRDNNGNRIVNVNTDTGSTWTVRDIVNATDVSSQSIDTNIADGNWHIAVMHIDTDNGNISVTVDGVLIYDGAVSSLQGIQVGGLEIDWAGTAGTGIIHLDNIEVYNNGSLAIRYDFEDNTTQGWQLITGETGSIGVATDELETKVISKPLPVTPFAIADNCIAYIPSINKMYLIGGYGSSADDTLNSNYEFDLDSKTWSAKANMPVSLWGMSCVYNPKDGKIYVFGGCLDGSCSQVNNNIYVYDPDSDTWETRSGVAITRGSMAVFVPEDGKIHIISESLPTCHSSYDYESNTFTDEPAPPYCVRWGVLTYYDGKLYLVSGTDPSTNTKTARLMVYDLATKQWTTKTAPPISGHGFIREWGWLNGLLYIVDMLDNNGKFYGRLYEYNPDTDTWGLKGYLLYARDGVVGYIGKDGNIYVISGRDSTDSPKGLNYIEAVNIKDTKVLIMSSHSDTYGFTGDQVTVIVLDEDNNPVASANVTIYKDGNQYTTCTTDTNGQCTFTPDSTGKYYAEVS